MTPTITVKQYPVAVIVSGFIALFLALISGLGWKWRDYFICPFMLYVGISQLRVGFKSLKKDTTWEETSEI